MFSFVTIQKSCLLVSFIYTKIWWLGFIFLGLTKSSHWLWFKYSVWLFQCQFTFWWERVFSWTKFSPVSCCHWNRGKNFQKCFNSRKFYEFFNLKIYLYIFNLRNKISILRRGTNQYHKRFKFWAKKLR